MPSMVRERMDGGSGMEGREVMMAYSPCLLPQGRG
jgi:hypothetical protein